MQLSPLSRPTLATEGSGSGWWVALANPLGRTPAIGFLFTGVTAVAAAATSLELSKGLVADRTERFLDGQLASRRHFVEELTPLVGLLRVWMRRGRQPSLQAIALLKSQFETNHSAPSDG